MHLTLRWITCFSVSPGKPALGDGGDGGSRAIAAAVAGTAVRELELGGGGASPEALAEAKAAALARRIRPILQRIATDVVGPELDAESRLAGLGLSDAHVPGLSDALAANRSLTALDCRGCAFSAAGVARLAAGVRGGGVLRRLELSAGAAGVPFSAGDAVVLTADYENRANDDPLKPGDVGTVVELHTSGTHYRVAYKGTEARSTGGLRASSGGLHNIKQILR